jgi:NAD(P)-dependent dehydrogenase (short-subunit alcohol dehydrogenase family)
MSTAPRATPVDLTDQVALVTGGGRGLGRAFALALAAAEAKVAVMARTAAQLEETVQLIEGAGGCALAIPGDVSVPAAVAHVVTTTEQQLGPVDLLVNNAGWYAPGSLGYAWEVGPEAWWYTFEINLRGAFLCARALLPGMLQRHRGRIVNVSSGTPINADPLWEALCASKAALTHWARLCGKNYRNKSETLRIDFLCGQPKRRVDDAVLCEDIPLGGPFQLAFAERVHGFIALNGPLRRGEGPKPQPRIHTAFDKPEILF